MKLRVFLLLLPALFLCTAPLYAGKKGDAKKQIETMNQKMKAAADKGNLQEAIEAAEKAFDAAVEGYGAESMEAGKAMNNMANLYMFANHAEDAERLYKKSIIIGIKNLEANSPELADSYYNLAMAYAVQKKYDEAREMMDKVYKMRTERLGPNHPDTQKAQKTLDELWKASTGT